MMRFIALTVCLLGAMVSAAQGEQSAVLRYGGIIDGRMEVHFELGRVALADAGDGWLAVEAEGMECRASREGLPALPEMCRLIAVAQGSVVSLERWQAGREERLTLGEGQRLLPWAGAAVKDAEPSATEPDKEAYASNTFASYAPMVSLDDLGTMGDRHIYRLVVRPAAYNPVEGVLRIAGEVDVTLTVGDMAAELLPGDSPLLPERFLIVSRPQFRGGLQPFVRWKRQEGYAVEEIYVETNDRDTVRALIRARWHDDEARWGRTGTTPAYLLLVGDAEELQAFVGYSRPAGLSPHATDLYYAEHTGDYLPDAAVGRWPVSSNSQLDALVDKTLAYEQGHGLDTATLRRVLLVAGREAYSPAPTTTNGQVTYLSRELKTVNPSLDTLCYYNPASDSQRSDILADAAQGVSLINYTAHCTVGGWSHPAVSFSTLDTLGEPQPTFYVNNCCQSNDFSGTGFGEQLLRKVQGGAVGVVGATNSTLWQEDYYWAVGPKYPLALEPQYDAQRPGAFDRWLGRTGGVATAGDLLLAGNLAVMASGSPYDRFYWEIYCLLGDPTLRPWVGLPDTAWVVVDSTIVEGDREISVTSTPGARVTALQDTLLMGVGMADSLGRCVLTLIAPLDTLPVVLTASGAGLIPAVDTVAVGRVDTCSAVTFRHLTVCDTLVACRVANIGTDTLTEVWLTLLQTTQMLAEMPQVAGVDTVCRLLDTLRPGEEIPVELPLRVSRMGQVPMWKVRLAAQQGDSCQGTVLNHIDLSHGYQEIYPELLLDLLKADSTPADAISLEEPCLVSVTTSHPCEEVIVDTAWLSEGVGHLRIDVTLRNGNWEQSERYYVPCGTAFDGFEQGLGCYPWKEGGTQPWRLDSSEVHSGRYSLRSGQIDGRQTSDLKLEVWLPHADTLSFWSRPSSEPQADRLYFSVDGVTKLDRWGQGQWRRDVFPLEAGRHTLRWRYVKDESVSQYNDCAWIDDISLPLALWNAPYGCETDTAGVGIDSPSLPRQEHNLTLYPNPASHRTTLQADRLVEEVCLTDLYGRRLITQPTAQATRCTLDLGGLPDGVYIVSCRMSDGSTLHSRLAISH